MQNVEGFKQKILIEQTKLEKNKELLSLAKSNDFQRTTELNKDNFASKKLLDNARITFEKAKSKVGSKNIRHSCM